MPIQCGGGEPCLKVASAGTFYLYDGDVLVATFDHRDSVIDMFVNSPQGRIASYYQNNSSYLYYFISDQLGSTRVVMKGVPPASPSNPYIVAEYYNYYPFGQVAEQYGNYPTSFQWTSKEHDQHGGFDYVYFGSRYYDPKIGAFGTVDKAGQFASGYVYGANNPIIGVDRDGNFFGILVPMLWGALYSTGPAVATAAVTGDWRGVGKSILAGAISGGIGSGMSAVVGKAANGAAYGLLSHAATSASTSALMGNKVSLAGIASSAVGGLAATKVMGQFNASSGGWFKNAALETLHSTASGVVSGFATGVTYNALMGRGLGENLGNFVGMGALGGASGAIWRNAVFGAPTLPEGSHAQEVRNIVDATGSKVKPLFRSGGLFGAVGLFRSGFAGFGREIIVNQRDRKGTINDEWAHETWHFAQYAEKGYGRALATLTSEQLQGYPWNDPYGVPGNLEYQADYYAHIMTGQWEQWFRNY